MTTSTAEIKISPVTTVSVTEDTLTVDLADGRTISVPLEWFPRLVHATETERTHFKVSAGGDGIHWVDLDEDIGIEGLLAGRASGESQKSLKRWLDKRARG